MSNREIVYGGRWRHQNGTVYEVFGETAFGEIPEGMPPSFWAVDEQDESMLAVYCLESGEILLSYEGELTEEPHVLYNEPGSSKVWARVKDNFLGMRQGSYRFTEEAV